jgi:hypothetical protein
MPKGPRGEKRPADVIGNAVKVMRIATGEETDESSRETIRNEPNKTKPKKRTTVRK